jgi:hypothetical protein
MRYPAADFGRYQTLAITSFGGNNSVIIRPMQTLSNVKYLARFVLAWFVLSLGVAVASPLVKPQAMEPICSAAGVAKMPVQVDGHGQAPARHTLNCPQCVP